MEDRARGLKVGVPLTARFRGRTYRARLVQADPGELTGPDDHGMRVRLEDGRVFRSYLDAAVAITGGPAAPKRFWWVGDADTYPPAALPGESGQTG